MIMFLSSFMVLDSKNRVAIPAPFRSTINNSNENTFIFKSLKYECLEVHLSSKINYQLKVLRKKIFYQKKMIILNSNTLRFRRNNNR